jgi:predicted transglutaminase-like protease
MPELKLKYPNAEVVIFEQSELPQIIKFIETLECEEFEISRDDIPILKIEKKDGILFLSKLDES